MYFDQFNVVKLITIQVVLGEVSFTNSSMMMVLGVNIFLLLLEGNKLISNRWQFILEFIYINIHSVVQDNLGKLGQKFFPFVLSFFIYCYVKYFRTIPLCVCSYGSNSNNLGNFFDNNNGGKIIRGFKL